MLRFPYAYQKTNLVQSGRLEKNAMLCSNPRTPWVSLRGLESTY